jgi:hypothetical protein
MKSFFTVLLGILSLVLLFFGNMHWQEKIEKAGALTVTNLDAKETTEPSVVKTPDEQVLSYTSNWTDIERLNLQTAIKEKRPYHILIAGSQLLGEGETSWPSLLNKEIIDSYGENVISTVTKTYSDTTEEFISLGKQTEFIEENADLIIWEPFTLTDNGVVEIEVSLNNILTVINEVKAVNSNTVFILQPPSPVYQPKLYKFQVEALKAFAIENEILLLDHWTNWPDPTSEEMFAYLNEGESSPNEEGHRVWAEFLIDRFVSK